MANFHLLLSCHVIGNIITYFATILKNISSSYRSKVLISASVCLSLFLSFSLFLSLCFRFQVMLCQYDLLLIRTAIIYITKCFLTCPCILIGFHVDFFVCVFLFCILLLLNVYSSNWNVFGLVRSVSRKHWHQDLIKSTATQKM